MSAERQPVLEAFVLHTHTLLTPPSNGWKEKQCFNGNKSLNLWGFPPYPPPPSIQTDIHQHCWWPCVWMCEGGGQRKRAKSLEGMSHHNHPCSRFRTNLSVSPCWHAVHRDQPGLYDYSLLQLSICRYRIYHQTSNERALTAVHFLRKIG